MGMDGEGIDYQNATISLKRLLPEVGDCITITNRGGYWELQQQELAPAQLTDEDIQHLKSGTMVWH